MIGYGAEVYGGLIKLHLWESVSQQDVLFLPCWGWKLGPGGRCSVSSIPGQGQPLGSCRLHGYGGPGHPKHAR